MLTPIIFLSGGFILLVAGAETLVRGSTNIALRAGISPLIVGLTIVAFGTSAPEFAVSIRSITSDLSGLALGNVIGSNIANIGLILGITALINPLRITRQLLRNQIPQMIAASLLLWILLLDNSLDFFDGMILTTALLAFLVYNFRQASAETQDQDIPIAAPDFSLIARGIPFDIVLVIVGMALLVYGSNIFVSNAVTIARAVGVSEAVIGLTLVAIGTSMPELATCSIAAFRKQTDIALGNIIGSNLFNILGILGITSLIAPINGDQISSQDFIFLMLFALILYPMARSGMNINRTEGAFLLSGYLVFLVFAFSL
ncbi:MAG: calcium/sodium antiporter [Proteobacteria bacterium]|nr:calcium/sodium antiporter [Pseudomonadota bacterium]